MEAVLTCLNEEHDRLLLAAAAAICLVGVYASFTIAQHAGRLENRAKRNWGLVSIVSAGCTAWATHMVALLAYRPGMQSGFDPVLTVLSLVIVIAGIGLSIGLAIGQRDRRRRFGAGLVLGLSVTALHYVGQTAYRVTGHVTWDLPLVSATIAVSLVMYGVAMVAAAERSRMVRRLAAPLLLAAIAVLHVGGMTAMRLTFDPRIRLSEMTFAPEIVSPVVAGVCLGLIAMAILGLRFTLNAQAQLRRDRARLNELANLAVEGLAVCDGDMIVSANDSLVRMSGLRRQEMVGRSLRTIIPAIDPSQMIERDEYDTELVGSSGCVVPVRVLRSEVSVGSKRQTVFAFRDQSERLRSESTIRRLAYTDALTGLTNRLRFTELLEWRVAQGRTAAHPFALLAIDLDRFKWVNDTLGHMIGDDLLRQVADRLREGAGHDASIARLGGDEFTILIPGASDTASAAAAQILRFVTQPFTTNGQIVEIGASVGIALSETDGASADELSRHADLALYRAKQAGGGSFCFFEPQMMLEALARRRLEMDLRRALEHDELEVHYQPQVAAADGSFEGAEALVRWNHPERGMVSPATFIPLAEEIGLIGAIGERVLRIACSEAAGWDDALSLAVNLSALQLGDPDLVSAVAAILAETGFPARRLELEVTESALLRDDSRTYTNLHGLKDLGIRISLDDFGTGYSSLSHLRRFPFDKVKIDQSFVRQIPDDADSVAIVQAVIMLAAKLRMTVTIEGIEEVAQRQFATDEGCDQIQGFLISRPVTGRDVRALFAHGDAVTLAALA